MTTGEVSNSLAGCVTSSRTCIAWQCALCLLPLAHSPVADLLASSMLSSLLVVPSCRCGLEASAYGRQALSKVRVSRSALCWLSRPSLLFCRRGLLVHVSTPWFGKR